MVKAGKSQVTKGKLKLMGKGMVWTMQSNLPKQRTFAKEERESLEHSVI